MATTSYSTSSIRYTLPSRTNGEPHVIQVAPYDGITTCSCKAGQVNRLCWAQQKVIAGQAGKPVVRVSLRPARRSVSSLYHTSAAELEV